jgi:hypothetical protein
LTPHLTLSILFIVRIGSLGIVFFFSLLPLAVQAQSVQPEGYSHPNLDWKTIETKHFTVSYHANDYDGKKGPERTAQLVAKIAEEVFPAITSLYNHDPGKVHFVIKDTDDYSNGGAYFFENKIEIWAPSLEFPLRGQHNWLRNVITHEFTHIVSLTTAMKYSQTVPGIYLQFFGYEQVRRTDVLYGFPNRLVSYPLMGINVPFWLAEGVAQYQRPQLGYETWDTHRDMLLRSRTLENKLMKLDEISNLVIVPGFGAEYSYNMGYAFTRFLADRYGEKKIKELCKNFGGITTFNVYHALKETYDKDGSDIYTEWKSYLTKDYVRRTEAIKAAEQSGTVLDKEGTNLHPLFSPDGKKIYYISNGGAERGGYGLVVRQAGTKGDFQTASRLSTVRDVFGLNGDEQVQGNTCKVCGLHFTEAEPLKSGIYSRLALTKDGRKILYTKYGGTTFKVEQRHDLFLFDLDSKNETRLTVQERLEMPALSPDNDLIAAVYQQDGTQNLVELEFNGATTKNLKRLTTYTGGEQVTSPIYSPDGKQIYFALGIDKFRRLMVFDRESGNIFPLLEESESPRNAPRPNDNRDLSLSPDGKFLFFSSDRTGIFNIYRLNLASRQVEQMTNVLTGAFMPQADSSGNLTYSHFTADGYRIAWLKEAQPVGGIAGEYLREPSAISRFANGSTPAEYVTTEIPSASPTFENSKPIRFDNSLENIGDTAFSTLAAYNDNQVPKFPTRDYQTTFNSFMITPLLRFDAYAQSQGSFIKDTWRNMKVGAAVSAGEVLGRLNFFGTFAFAPGSGLDGNTGGLFSGALGLERDAYLSFEYADKFFLPASMASRLTLDIFHITRNVQDAARIEVGLGNAKANVFYSLLQFDLSLRFRIPIENFIFKRSSFRLAGSFSTYSSTVGSFLFRPNGPADPINEQIVSASSNNYFIGRSASLFCTTDLTTRQFINGSINPKGLLTRFQVDLENSRLQDTIIFNASNGTLRPGYKDFIFTRLTGDVNFYMPLPSWNRRFDHTLSLRTYGVFNVSSKETDFFFKNFISGLLGMRGYEFFALGGDKAMFAHVEYRLPVVRNIGFQLAQLYLNDLYISTYFDIGTAWDVGSVPSLGNWRKDVGVEFRLSAPSFYLVPTSVFFSATYGLDQFQQQLRPQFFTADGRNFVEYGREWVFHFGVLFGFDFFTDIARMGSRYALR